MEIMKPFRQRIDALDDQIIDLLIARTEIIREVGHFKFAHDIPAVLADRVIEVR
ncbi:MAG TPA: chorismate mutase, partial [Micavibrio sp.]